MTDEIVRRSLLSHTPLTGWFRYVDLFQLMPAPLGAPRPPSPMGDHPRIPPDRETDSWHRDLFERERLKVLSPGATDDGLAAVRRGMQWLRTEALVKELTVS